MHRDGTQSRVNSELGPLLLVVGSSVLDTLNDGSVDEGQLYLVYPVLIA